MRVLHILTACPYSEEESEILTPWLWRILREVERKGVKVELFCPRYLGREGERFGDFYVHRFSYFFPRGEILGYKTAIPELLKFNRWAKFLIPFYITSGFLNALILSGKENYDVIHVHWPIPLSLFSLPFKVKGTPVVHSYYTAEVKLAESLGILGKVLKILVKTANVKTAISTYSAKLLGKENVIILPYSSALEFKELFPPKEKPENPRILFVGRLVERKGVIYLIWAMRILKERGIKAELRIVGEGLLMESLKNSAKDLDSVKFLGKLSAEDLMEEYKRSDIFVLPSIVDSRGDTEGLGVVLLEALSFGLPVIASNVGGIPDIVEDGKTGILVPEKDPVAIADAIEKLLSNWENAKLMVLRGQEMIRERFSSEKIADKLVRIYDYLHRGSPTLEMG
ncbi:MAG: glycosyltransferase family 4 protein [Candidatus Caldipriscus sp.]